MAERLTDAIAKRLPLPAAGMRIHYDNDVPGFGLRITAAGAKSYVLRYRVRGNGRDRTFTIGSAAVWRVSEARAEAKRLKQAIDQGGDPLGDLQDERAAPTMAALCERFEAEHVVRKRASTAADYRRMLKNHIRPHFGAHIKVGDVRFEHIDALHRKLTDAGYPYAANRSAALISKMFNLAIRWNMRTDNPARGIERNYEAKRRRYLIGDELPRLTQALAEHADRQAADIIRILLLTGCRLGEALAMRWADLDLTTGVWSKPGSTTKQKSDHIAPLSAPARQLLADICAEHARLHPKRPLGEFVFPGRYNGYRQTIKKNWTAICRAAQITGLRVHDLRHSFASQLASGGASLHLIGALLGHSNPATTHRYAHLFDDPLRQAVERVGAAIESAGKPAPEPVGLKGR